VKLLSTRMLAASVIVGLLGAVALPAWAASEKNPKPEEFAAQDDPPAVVHWAKGQGGGAGVQPNMTWHNGPVLQTTAVTPIFWGSSWGSYKGDEITGIDLFYAGVGNSNYAKTTNEYNDNHGYVTAAITPTAHLLDASSAPSRAPRTSAILAEVCKEIKAPVSNGYYPVYTDSGRRNASYCAWHSWGSCNGVQVQFAFFFKLDGDPGCDPGDISGVHSQGLAALANVSGHELSEAVTDPRGTGWFDSSGAENGDKCAWTFGTKPLTFSNGSQWTIQGNWSNAANSGNTGYVRGCIDGTN